MSDFIVHTVPGSPFARAVFATLEEKHTPYRIAPIAPGGGRIEPHISRHPWGRMPVLEHGDFMLYETAAIMRYIDRIIPSPALTPIDPRAAARMDQMMNICDWYLFQGVSNVIGFQRIVGPRLRGLVPDEALIAEAMPKAPTVFNEIARLLGEKTFLTGDTVSLADLIIAPHFDFLSQTPEWAALVAGNANLIAWFRRVMARPSLQATTWEKVSEMAKAA
jgi:glutathione S-transferase